MSRFVELGCWILALLGTALAVRRVTTAPEVPVIRPQLADAPRIALLDVDSADVLVSEIAFGGLFGSSSDHSIESRAEEANGESSAPPPSPVRAIQLSGIVGGPPWSAVLEDVPDREGAVIVNSGDRVAGLFVTAVTRDSAMLRGPDSSFVLRLRRAWQ